ncbi:unnamed protein product [Zymoseptoria tritici ST99CH_1E4]|uniref:Integrase catalytic domain-containing protein n=1 Tax=Zymoseptoria tritici ST99CH_1E4 TaxID=1276532 RepID=A0A2H1FJU6_ZYMTR|nr:unnamed protein product [Zymoseptoria tritici ST99CH_1E4]
MWNATFPLDSAPAAIAAYKAVKSDDVTLRDAKLAEVKKGLFRKFDWIVDSGTTSYVCNEKSLFTDYEELPKPIEMIGCGRGFFAVGVGKVVLSALRPKGVTELVLTKVIHVPQMSVNLVSVSSINRNNTNYVSTHGSCYFEDKTTEEVLFTGTQYGSLWKLDISLGRTYNAHWSEDPEIMSAFNTSFFNSNTVRRLPLLIWHERLGHIGDTPLREMLHRREIAFIDEKFSCESCNRNKLKQKFATSEPVRAQNLLTKVYIDLGGPLPDLISGEVYYLLIVDDYTRYGWLYTLKTKQAQEVYRCYYDFEIRMHRQFGAVIKEARADGGTEFTSIIANVAHAAGLHFTASVPY